MATHFDVDDSYAVEEEDPCQPATFAFPDVCCRCLAPAPEKGWKVGSGKQVAHNCWVNFVVSVPVCAACWSQLMKIRVLLVSATVSVMLLMLAVVYLLDPFELNGTEPSNMAAGYAVIALFLSPVSIGVYYLLGAVVAPRRTRAVARLSRDGDQVTFFNPEYQRLFLEHSRGPRTDSPGW